MGGPAVEYRGIPQCPAPSSISSLLCGNIASAIGMLCLLMYFESPPLMKSVGLSKVTPSDGSYGKSPILSIEFCRISSGMRKRHGESLSLRCRLVNRNCRTGRLCGTSLVEPISSVKMPSSPIRIPARSHRLPSCSRRSQLRFCAYPRCTGQIPSIFGLVRGTCRPRSSA